MPRRKNKKSTNTLSLAQCQEQFDRARKTLDETEKQQEDSLSHLRVSVKAFGSSGEQVLPAKRRASSLTTEVGRLTKICTELAERIIELSPRADELAPLCSRLQDYTNVTFGSLYWASRHHVAEVRKLLTSIDADTSTAVQLTSITQALSDMKPKDGGAISNILKDCRQLMQKYKLPLSTAAAVVPSHR